MNNIRRYIHAYLTVNSNVNTLCTNLYLMVAETSAPIGE